MLINFIKNNSGFYYIRLGRLYYTKEINNVIVVKLITNTPENSEFYNGSKIKTIEVFNMYFNRNVINLKKKIKFID